MASNRVELLEGLAPLFAAVLGRGVGEVRFTVHGVEGHGKSKLLHQLLNFVAPLPDGQYYFLSMASINGVTPAAESKTLEHAGLRVTCTDQAGLLNARPGADLAALRAQVIGDQHGRGYHVVFLVQSITDRNSAATTAALTMARNVYGDQCSAHLVVILTKADLLTTQAEQDTMVAEYCADMAGLFGQVLPVLAVTLEDGSQMRNGQTVADGMKQVWTAALNLVLAQPVALQPPTPPVVHVPSPQPPPAQSEVVPTPVAIGVAVAFPPAAPFVALGKIFKWF